MKPGYYYCAYTDGLYLVYVENGKADCFLDGKWHVTPWKFRGCGFDSYLGPL